MQKSGVTGDEALKEIMATAIKSAIDKFITGKLSGNKVTILKSTSAKASILYWMMTDPTYGRIA